MLVPHRKHMYGTPRTFTEIALLLYVDDVRTSQETLLFTRTAYYYDSFSFFLCWTLDGRNIFILVQECVRNYLDLVLA
jgi:hypothetical protein